MWNIIEPKKGVSEIVSYVLLIAIVLFVSMLLFAWLKPIIMGVKPATSCEDPTSISISEIKCEGASINLTIKNNGRFKIDGITIAASNDTASEPQYALMPAMEGGYIAGHYRFKEVLAPGNETNIVFSMNYRDLISNERIVLNKIGKIRIQPFIVSKKTNVYCSNSVITQEVVGCSNL